MHDKDIKEKILQLCANLADEVRKDGSIDNLLFSFFLYFPNAYAATAIRQLFAKIACGTEGKYSYRDQHLIAFNRHNLSAMTTEELEGAHGLFFNNTWNALQKSKRLEDSLNKVSESTHTPIEEIQSMIEYKIEELRTAFDDKNSSYADRNCVIRDGLGDLFIKIIDSKQLEDMVHAMSSSLSIRI